MEGNFYARCPPEQRPIGVYHAQNSKSDDFAGPKASATQTATNKDIESSGITVTIEEKVSKSPEVTPEKASVQPEPSDNQPKYDSSLLKAIHTTFFWSWWSSGVMKLLSGMLSYFPTFWGPSNCSCPDTLKTTTPLINKALLTWLTNSYIFYRASEAERSAFSLSQPKGIGFGIGLAFALFIMQGSSLAFYDSRCLLTYVLH